MHAYLFAWGMVVNVDGFTYPCCEYLSKRTRQTNKGVKTPDLTNNNVHCKPIPVMKTGIPAM